MATPFDRFLRRRSAISHSDTLGRVFNVTRESWALSADPRRTPPRTELIASHRTATDAADLARALAAEHQRNGFHKPSGAWWGADEAAFHRFAVHAGKHRRLAATPVVALGAAGLMALAVTWLTRKRRRAGGKGGDAG
jgi:hypothetical protein